jgi:NAD(P)-dependent dehydrogenase (short-subunit alcohol dehydrogenase family)
MEYLRKNIRINYISPGCVLTPVNVPLEKVMKSQLPLGRLAQPEEIARVVLFLASEESSFVTASGVIADHN